MRRVECGPTAVLERSERTAQGYRRFRCRDCGKQFNERKKGISISGDGGFLFSSMELETTVRLKCNRVYMIWIDGTYDMVAEQEKIKYGRSSECDLGPVDPVKYAEAFGATGMMINTPDEIGPALKKAMVTVGPVIIGVNVDYSDNHKLFEMVDERSIQ